MIIYVGRMCNSSPDDGLIKAVAVINSLPSFSMRGLNNLKYWLAKSAKLVLMEIISLRKFFYQFKVMPYSGAQGRACYARASACLEAGRRPLWSCQDNWDYVLPPDTGERQTVVSGAQGQYVQGCGAPLPSNFPAHNPHELNQLADQGFVAPHPPHSPRSSTSLRFGDAGGSPRRVTFAPQLTNYAPASPRRLSYTAPTSPRTSSGSRTLSPRQAFLATYSPTRYY